MDRPEKLKLPDVTLVCVETREHQLARMAVEDCLKVAEFGDVLILSNSKIAFKSPDAFNTPKKDYRGNYWDDTTGPDEMCGQPVRFHHVPDWPTKEGWSRSWWFDVPLLLRTKQTLNIQWDSWISDASQWRDDFMGYDYIGAPWWYKDGKNVGNGGFSLVSSRLKRYVYDRRDQYPCDTSVDDDLMCRKYRPRLENAGFVWAPEDVADKFAYEGCGMPRPFRQHFGFHGMFNWPKVLDYDRLLERFSIAIQSPALSKPDSYIMKSFCEMNPEIVRKLLAANSDPMKQEL